MNGRSRIFIAVVLLYIAGVGLALTQVLGSIDPRYRESAEESLVETAHLMASLLEQDLQGGQIQTTRLATLFDQVARHTVAAHIFSVPKDRIDLRCYVTDGQGRLLYNSLGGPMGQAGQDYAQWRDVALALQGRYGARTTPDVPGNPASAVMYVAAPVRAGDRTVGVVTVGKPVSSLDRFIAVARQKTLVAGLLLATAGLALALVLSAWLVRPFGLVGDLWRHVQQARQRSAFSWRRLGHRTVLAWRESLDDMRDALAGRNTVAEHVQTLTHEIKSPLAAIQAAAELLQEPLPAAQHQRFVGHILRESQRIQETVDRMMELTAARARRTLDDAALLDLNLLLQQALDTAQAAITAKALTVTLAASAGPLAVQGDAFLLRRAIANLLDNAVDFAPAGSPLEISLQPDTRLRPPMACLQLRDHGPGVPPYARQRVFEQFYSLPRPGTGKKSTGLGLALVKAVAQLHRGSISLDNHEGGGALARLCLPLQPALPAAPASPIHPSQSPLP